MSPSIIDNTEKNTSKNAKVQKTKTTEMNKFEKTLEASKGILFQTKSVFPFDFFPNEIVIDENKVDLIYGLFFFSREVFSISIKNINSAGSSSNLFFGELSIELEGYNENPKPIKYLWRKDAIKARRIINGLITLNKQNVNIARLNIVELKKKVEEIGLAAEHVKST